MGEVAPADLLLPRLHHGSWLEWYDTSALVLGFIEGSVMKAVDQAQTLLPQQFIRIFHNDVVFVLE